MTRDPATLNMGDSHLVVDICRQHDFPTFTKEPQTGIEIGCYRGATSQKLLAAFPDLMLYMVDKWQGNLPADHPYVASGDGASKLTQAEQDENRAAAERATLFGGMASRRTVLQVSSEVAEQRLGGRVFDFVFIDAEHTYAATSKDISLWWPRVRTGGILAGHDYGHKRYPGVEQAVREFCKASGVKFRLMGSCWWVVKP